MIHEVVHIHKYLVEITCNYFVIYKVIWFYAFLDSTKITGFLKSILVNI